MNQKVIPVFTCLTPAADNLIIVVALFLCVIVKCREMNWLCFFPCDLRKVEKQKIIRFETINEKIVWDDIWSEEFLITVKEFIKLEKSRDHH